MPDQHFIDSKGRESNVSPKALFMSFVNKGEICADPGHSLKVFPYKEM